MTGNVPGDLIYPFDAAAGEALGRRESYTPKNRGAGTGES
jgi:hypothetical protein